MFSSRLNYNSSLNYTKLFIFIASVIYFVFVSTVFAYSSWTSQGNTIISHYNHKAVLLDNGKVIIVGGVSRNSSTNIVELFSPSLNGIGAWSLGRSLVQDRQFATLDLITMVGSGSGKVLTSGGSSSGCSCILNTSEIYNSELNTWTKTSNMNHARWGHSSSVVDDGKLIISGGSSNVYGTDRLNSVELFNPTSNAWSLKAPLNLGRIHHQQVTFKDINGVTKIMVIGGSIATSTSTSSTEIYDPVLNVWTYGPSMSYARGNRFSAIPLKDGRILVTGNDAPNYENSEVYDPKSNKWIIYKQRYKVDRLHSVVELGEKAGYKVLLAGGIDAASGDATSSAQLFDPQTNSWKPSTVMNISRYAFTLTLLNTGGVLATSGYNSLAQELSSSELYAPEEILGVSISPTPTPVPSIALTPSPTPPAFLDLPFDYIGQNKTFEDVALNPESWFDHKYPLQNFSCCIFKVLKYSGAEVVDAYRSHSGYDYASNNGVLLNTPVLAAASGSAELILEKHSGGAGNVIKIDHGNGYQTWYEHLSHNDLIVDEESVGVKVEKSQRIGKVGMTGSTNGPHIHFSVFKDENGNSNFSDDYPFGLVDPLGWDGDYKDPWTEWTNKVATGSASVNLFTNRALPKKVLIPTSGGALESKGIKITVPSGASTIPFTLHYRYGPFESPSATLKSAAPSFYLEAFNSVGDKIVEFLKPIVVRYDYSRADVSKFKEDTLKLHYFDILEQRWIPISSVPNLENKIIIAELRHFTQFALMGELKDITPPKTDINLLGDKGENEWYRSTVAIELNGMDNDGGLGMQYVLNSFDDNEWSEYLVPINVEEEGNHQISYQSFDKANNNEDRKTKKFSIDKTSPSTSAGTAGTKGENGWYVSDVEVFLVSHDDRSGVSRSEYALGDSEEYQAYTGQIKISKEGKTEILYRSVDKAGNVEIAKKLSIKIDKISPSTIVYTSGLRGRENWYRSNVEISLTGNDEGSGYKTSYYSIDNGVNYSEYLEPLIFNEEGEYKLLYYSEDIAGNKEEARSMIIKIDKTPPAISIGATPQYIWPPNGKMVDVRISGDVAEVNPYNTKFKVTDEYNLVEPVLTSFNQTIKLQAKRNGDDKNGRIYSVEASTEDMAGNKASESVNVIVPHDQQK
ncbi:MAG TPA: peptidoglycan DD-metalloendopeptidase family protein [Candidatus Limnocylindrales bacterium]|nr:peptidoglycan DD-metalloendopeptidase family protein [Candidatus Limnocylindrales bacterium]